MDRHATSASFYASFLAGTGVSSMFAYRLAILTADALATALLGPSASLAAAAVFSRGASVALGPAGWAVGLISLIPMLCGPAYRKTVPSVAIIGALRARVRAGIAPQ